MAQMAAPATIIGQIQPAQVTTGTVPQVPSQQQMQQQQLAQPMAQGVPLPASVPQIKQENDSGATDGGAQNVGEGAKENDCE